jgi:hypothetical protein
MNVTDACNNLGGGGTNDLSGFPSGAGSGLTAGGNPPTALPHLYPTFIRTHTSKWTYFCKDASTGTLDSKP